MHKEGVRRVIGVMGDVQCVICCPIYRSVCALCAVAIAGLVACSSGDQPGHTSSSVGSYSESAVMSPDSMVGMRDDDHPRVVPR
jgi:hypothetical protein